MTKVQKDFPPTPSQLSVLWNYLTLPWARGEGGGHTEAGSSGEIGIVFSLYLGG